MKIHLFFLSFFRFFLFIYFLFITIASHQETEKKKCIFLVVWFLRNNKQKKR